jgi:hypothetical protein
VPDNARLIIQVARGGAVDRQLRDSPPSGDAIVEVLAADAAGHLDPPDVGEVVLSVPSPESLAREPDTVRRAIRLAGRGPEPLVVIVEAAEELRDEELGAALDAAEHGDRPVILRIIRDA